MKKLTSQELVIAIAEEADALAMEKGYGLADTQAHLVGYLTIELMKAFDANPKYAARRSKELKQPTPQ